MYELVLLGKTIHIEDIGQAHRTAMANGIGVKLLQDGKSWDCDVSEHGIFIRDKSHPENVKLAGLRKYIEESEQYNTSTPINQCKTRFTGHSKKEMRGKTPRIFLRYEYYYVGSDEPRYAWVPEDRIS